MSDDQPTTTPSTPPESSRPSTAAAHTAPVFRRALRYTAVISAVLLVGGGAVGLLVAGLPGLWAALMGAAVALLFSGATPLSMLKTADAPIERSLLVVMATWLGKVVVVIAVLLVLRGMDFYSRPVFGIVLMLGVVTSAFLDYRAVVRARVPYVQPTSTPVQDQGPSDADDL